MAEGKEAVVVVLAAHYRERTVQRAVVREMAVVLIAAHYREMIVRRAGWRWVKFDALLAYWVMQAFQAL